MGQCCSACDSGAALAEAVAMEKEPRASTSEPSRLFFADEEQEVGPIEGELAEEEVAASGEEAGKKEGFRRRSLTCMLMSSIDEAEVEAGRKARTSTVLHHAKLDIDGTDPHVSSTFIAADMADTLAHPPGGTDGDAPSTAEILQEVQRFVDLEYDVLMADLLLDQLEQRLSPDKLDEVLMSPVVRRLERKLQYMTHVGKACCSKNDGWFSVYRDGPQSIEGMIDPADSTIMHYKARVTIPAKLTTVMAVANEVQLMSSWNKLVVGTPKVVGRRTGHYMVLNYQMSLAAGMYKLDLLNEVRRFSDTKGGILVEYIRSTDSQHPCYQPPAAGFKRPMTEVKNVWIACGENTSVLVQVGKVKLPFAATKWLASTVGGVAGRFIVGGLINNSLKAKEPRSPWESALEEDKLGFYERLGEVVASEGSMRRAPAAGSSVPQFQESDLEPLFGRRRGRRSRTRSVDSNEVGSVVTSTRSFLTMNSMNLP